MIPARQVNGKWLLVLSGVVIIISIVFVGFAFKALGPASNGTLFGTVFVNEGGYANATSSATASYNVTLTAQKGTGSLLLTLLSGKDLVQNHLLSFSNYSITTTKITMVISGHQMNLPWEDNDTIWNHHYDSNYIASWGPSAPAAEIRGQVAGSVFGLPAGDYIEFRFAAQSASVAHGY
ncbi:MAG TPA: hypothetical protein VEO75_02945 [Nitrososphaerales archaeon]|nr:hypothetical protein [Nitrososphaerales archaeon]